MLYNIYNTMGTTPITTYITLSACYFIVLLLCSAYIAAYSIKTLYITGINANDLREGNRQVSLLHCVMPLYGCVWLGYGNQRNSIFNNSKYTNYGYEDEHDNRCDMSMTYILQYLHDSWRPAWYEEAVCRGMQQRGSYPSDYRRTHPDWPHSDYRLAARITKLSHKGSRGVFSLVSCMVSGYYADEAKVGNNLCLPRKLGHIVSHGINLYYNVFTRYIDSMHECIDDVRGDETIHYNMCSIRLCLFYCMYCGKEYSVNDTMISAERYIFCNLQSRRTGGRQTMDEFAADLWARQDGACPVGCFSVCADQITSTDDTLTELNKLSLKIDLSVHQLKPRLRPAVRSSWHVQLSQLWIADYFRESPLRAVRDKYYRRGRLLAIDPIIGTMKSHSYIQMGDQCGIFKYYANLRMSSIQTICINDCFYEILILIWHGTLERIMCTLYYAEGWRIEQAIRNVFRAYDFDEVVYVLKRYIFCFFQDVRWELKRWEIAVVHGGRHTSRGPNICEGLHAALCGERNEYSYNMRELSVQYRVGGDLLLPLSDQCISNSGLCDEILIEVYVMSMFGCYTPEIIGSLCYIEVCTKVFVNIYCVSQCGVYPSELIYYCASTELIFRLVNSVYITVINIIRVYIIVINIMSQYMLIWEEVMRFCIRYTTQILEVNLYCNDNYKIRYIENLHNVYRFLCRIFVSENIKRYGMLNLQSVWQESICLWMSELLLSCFMYSTFYVYYSTHCLIYGIKNLFDFRTPHTLALDCKYKHRDHFSWRVITMRIQRYDDRCNCKKMFVSLYIYVCVLCHMISHASIRTFFGPWHDALDIFRIETRVLIWTEALTHTYIYGQVVCVMVIELYIIHYGE